MAIVSHKVCAASTEPWEVILGRKTETVPGRIAELLVGEFELMRRGKGGEPGPSVPGRAADEPLHVCPRSQFRGFELGKQSVVEEGTDGTLQALRSGLIRETLPEELGGCRGDVRLTGWQPFGQELLVARVQLTSQGDLRGPREEEGAALILEQEQTRTQHGR